jgi:hypothetical protein
MVQLKDCKVGDTVEINGQKAVIKDIDLGTVAVRYEGNEYLSKWYDSKKAIKCENQSTSQES